MPGCTIDEYARTPLQRVRTHPEVSQPLFTVIRLLLAKREIDELTVTILRRAERDHVLCHVREVISSIRVLACPETLSDAVCQFRRGWRVRDKSRTL